MALSQNISQIIKNKKNKNDRIYTPRCIALKAIEMCDIKENETVLDCSLGGGIFYTNLPTNCTKYWCEIDPIIVGDNPKDFFDFNMNVNLIIGNPPFSLWDKWLEKTVKIADRFCYIFGSLNLTDRRLRKIKASGFGATKIHQFAVNWWFGQYWVVLFEKGKDSIISVQDEIVLCDICGGRCDRGRKKNPFNICTKK